MKTTYKKGSLVEVISPFGRRFELFDHDNELIFIVGPEVVLLLEDAVVAKTPTTIKSKWYSSKVLYKNQIGLVTIFDYDKLLYDAS